MYKLTKHTSIIRPADDARLSELDAEAEALRVELTALPPLV